MNIPNHYTEATTLESKILYILNIMKKAAAPELAMEIAELDGVSSEEGLADLTISIEKELEKMCDDGVLEIIKEQRQKRRYALAENSGKSSASTS